MIQFKCEKCEKKITVTSDKAGRRAQCPHCGAIVNIPARALALFFIRAKGELLSLLAGKVHNSVKFGRFPGSP